MQRYTKGWIDIPRLIRITLLSLALLPITDIALAGTQTRTDVKLVLQITVDGFRGDLIQRYEI
ncbi:MAG: hypothetical protein ACWGNO_06815 [Desulfobacterales bacterium]